MVEAFERENKLKTKKIVGFMHVAMMNNWKEIVESQLKKIKKYGLYNKTDKIFVTLLGDSKNIDNNLFNDKKFDVIHNQNLRLYEFITLERIKEFAKNNDAKIWYTHTKGVSKNTIETKDWKNYMEYFLIEKNKECISYLDKYDACGVNFTKLPCPHFSGNFWWAKSDYIRTLPEISSLKKDEKLLKKLEVPYALGERHKAEMWIGLNKNAKFKEIFNSGVYHYRTKFPRNKYVGISFFTRTVVYKFRKFINNNFPRLCGVLKEIKGNSYLNRIQVINKILKKTGGKNYLEIGVSDGETFELINAKNKIGVDPIPSAKKVKAILGGNAKYFEKTSDVFFAETAEEIFKENKIDVVLIDSLHEYKQVLRDVQNCLKYLNDRGVIIMHDCNPTTKEMQIVPRTPVEWTGDVWKAIAHLRSTSDDLNIFVLDSDHGLGIITKGKPKNMLNYSIEDIEKMDYEDLDKNRKKILNLKDSKFFLKFMKQFHQKMKTLIIGSKGMLGTDLIKELSKTDNNVLDWDLENIDITKEEEMPKIEQEKPDIIINCAAYTNVDDAETEKDKCYAINVRGVKNLVNVCKKTGITLIQISTDYVFNGDKEGYNEDAEKNPINHYGETKADGEDLILKNLDKYYIIRTSWLFGKNGKNFVETMLRLFKEKEEIKVVNDQIGSPTYTKDLSKGIINLLSNPDKFKYGIYHLANGGKCSWFEFAKEIAMLKQLNCLIKPCTTEEFPRPAKRPRFSVLNNNKLEKLRSWKEALREYLE